MDILSEWIKEINDYATNNHNDKQLSLNKLSIMTVFSKTIVKEPNNRVFYSNESDLHFIICQKEEVNFFIETKGQQDIHWFLVDLVMEVEVKNQWVIIKYQVEEATITFSFDYKSKRHGYFLLNLLKQSKVKLNYLLDQQEYYCYLGLQHIDLYEELKKQILNHIEMGLKSVEVV